MKNFLFYMGSSIFVLRTKFPNTALPYARYTWTAWIIFNKNREFHRREKKHWSLRFFRTQNDPRLQMNPMIASVWTPQSLLYSRNIINKYIYIYWQHNVHILKVTIDSGERLFPVSRQQGKSPTGGQVGRQLRQASDAIENGFKHRIFAALARTVVIVPVDGLH